MRCSGEGFRPRGMDSSPPSVLMDSRNTRMYLGAPSEGADVQSRLMHLGTRKLKNFGDIGGKTLEDIRLGSIDWVSVELLHTSTVLRTVLNMTYPMKAEYVADRNAWVSNTESTNFQLPCFEEINRIYFDTNSSDEEEARDIDLVEKDEAVFRYGMPVPSIVMAVERTTGGKGVVQKTENESE